LDFRSKIEKCKHFFAAVGFRKLTLVIFWILVIWVPMLGKWIGPNIEISRCLVARRSSASWAGMAVGRDGRAGVWSGDLAHKHSCAPRHRINCLDYYIYIWIYIYIYGYQVPDTRSCQVPDRARYQIVPGRARSCQVPEPSSVGRWPLGLGH
jgi:hypothetical protein